MSGGVKGGLGWGRISCSRLLLQRCRRAITHQIGLILVAQEWQRCKICSGFEILRKLEMLYIKFNTSLRHKYQRQVERIYDRTGIG